MAGSVMRIHVRLFRLKGDNELESINRGDPYPSNYDRPHVLNLVVELPYQPAFYFFIQHGIYVGPSCYFSIITILY